MVDKVMDFNRIDNHQGLRSEIHKSSKKGVNIDYEEKTT